MRYSLTASIALGCLAAFSAANPSEWKRILRLASSSLDLNALDFTARSEYHASLQKRDEHLWKRDEPTYLGFASDYSFDANTVSNGQWMASIRDDVPLTNISIPGTHDTMTYSEALAVLGAQCQNNDLMTQLNAGIRYLDIRAWVLFNDLIIAHGIAPTGHRYQEVLQTVFSFLDANPTEVIIMRIREEDAPKWSNKNFVTEFLAYANTNPATAPGCQKHFWTPSSPGNTDLPPIGQLRGKVVILQGFGSDPAPYGIKWESPVLSIQDNYDAGTLQNLPTTKWVSIQNQFQNSASAGSNSLLYLNHLSASTQCLPISCATGNIGIKLFQGMNDMTGSYLQSAVVANRGIVIMDFPGSKLINLILANNVNLQA